MKDPHLLPVYKQKSKILKSIKRNQVIVVESPTGSGKTTQIPQILLEAGYAKSGIIGITQPRRIAAVSVAGHGGAGVLSVDSVLFGSITKLSGNENYMHVSQVYRNTRNIWVKDKNGSVSLLNPQPNF